MANRNIVNVSAKAQLKNEGFLSKLSSTLQTRRLPPPEQLEVRSSLTWHKTTEVKERIKTATGTFAVYSDMTEEEIQELKESVAMVPTLEEARENKGLEPDIASTVIAEAATIAVQSIGDSSVTKPSTIYIAIDHYTPDTVDGLPLISGQKVELIEASSNKRPRLEPSDGVQLLDNAAARHKMAIRPKKNHPSSRAKVAQDSREEERWLVRDFESGNEGWVPAHLLGAAPPSAAFASSIKRSLQDLTAEESKEIKRKLTKEMKEIKSSKIRKSSSRILGPSPEDEARAKRSATIRELIETEEEFVKDLEFVMKHYFSMVDLASTPKRIKDSKDVVFGNFDKIAEFHQSVLIEGVKYHAEVPNLIGKTFLRLERDFDMHSEYCSNEPLADQFLENNLDCKDFYEAYSEKIGDDKRVQEHLKLPIQRLNDYQLLLKEIIKYSNRLGDETSDLERAYDLMQTIPQRATDAKFLASIEGYKGNLFKLGRLIRHDWFSVAETGHKPRDRYLFLFKARVLITKVKRIAEERSIFVLKDIIRLPETSLCGLERPRILEFHHIEPQNHPNFPIIFEARTQEARDAWLDVVREHVIDTASVDDLLFDDEIRVVSEEGEDIIEDLPEDLGDQVVPEFQESKTSEFETLGPPEILKEESKPSEVLIPVAKLPERLIPIELDSSFKRSLEKEEDPDLVFGAESSPPTKKRVISPKPEDFFFEEPKEPKSEVSIPIEFAPSLKSEQNQRQQISDDFKEQESEPDFKPKSEPELETFIDTASEPIQEPVKEPEKEPEPIFESFIEPETLKTPEPLKPLTAELESSTDVKKSPVTTPKRAKEEEEFDFWGPRESSPPPKKRASSPPEKKKPTSGVPEEDFKLEQVEITAFKAEKKVAEQSEDLKLQIQEETKNQEHNKMANSYTQDEDFQARFRSNRFRQSANEEFGWRKAYQKRLLEEAKKADQRSYEEYKKGKQIEEEEEEIIYINSDELEDFLERNCLIYIEDSDSEDEKEAKKPKGGIIKTKEEEEESDDSTSKSYISDEEEKLPPRISYKRLIILEKERIKIRFAGLDEDEADAHKEEEKKDEMEDIWEGRESPINRKRNITENEIEGIWEGRESPQHKRINVEETEIDDFWEGRKSPVNEINKMESTEIEDIWEEKESLICKRKNNDEPEIDIWEGRESPISKRKNIEVTQIEDIWEGSETSNNKIINIVEPEISDFWEGIESPINKRRKTENIEIEDMWEGITSSTDKSKNYEESEIEDIWEGRESLSSKEKYIKETETENIWEDRESPINKRNYMEEIQMEDIWEGRESPVSRKIYIEDIKMTNNLENDGYYINQENDIEGSEVDDIWKGKDSHINKQKDIQVAEIENLWEGKESPVYKKKNIGESEFEDVWEDINSPLNELNKFKETELQDIWKKEKSLDIERKNTEETEIDYDCESRESPISERRTTDESDKEDIWDEGRKSLNNKNKNSDKVDLDNIWKKSDSHDVNMENIEESEIEESEIEESKIEDIWEGRNSPCNRRKNIENFEVDVMREDIERRDIDSEIEDLWEGRASPIYKRKNMDENVVKDIWLERDYLDQNKNDGEIEIENICEINESCLKNMNNTEESEIEDIWEGRESPITKRKNTSKIEIEDIWENEESQITKIKNIEDAEIKDIWEDKESPISKRKNTSETEIEDIWEEEESSATKGKNTTESEIEDIWECKESPISKRKNTSETDIEDIWEDEESSINKGKNIVEPEFENIWEDTKSPINKLNDTRKTEIKDIWNDEESQVAKNNYIVETEIEDIWEGRDSFICKKRQTIDESESEGMWTNTMVPNSEIQEIKESEIEDIWEGRDSFICKKRQTIEESESEGMWTNTMVPKSEIQEIKETIEDIWDGRDSFINKNRQNIEETATDDIWKYRDSFTYKEEFADETEIQDIWEGKESTFNIRQNIAKETTETELSQGISDDLQLLKIKSDHDSEDEIEYSSSEVEFDDNSTSASSLDLSGIRYSFNGSDIEEELDNYSMQENIQDVELKAVNINESNSTTIEMETKERLKTRRKKTPKKVNKNISVKVTEDSATNSTQYITIKIGNKSELLKNTCETDSPIEMPNTGEIPKSAADIGCETPSRSLLYITCKSNVSESNTEADSTSDSNYKIEGIDSEENDDEKDEESEEESSNKEAENSNTENEENESENDLSKTNKPENMNLRSNLSQFYLDYKQRIVIESSIDTNDLGIKATDTPTPINKFSNYLEANSSDLLSDIMFSECNSTIFNDEITEESIGDGNATKDDFILEKYDYLEEQFGFNINKLDGKHNPNPESEVTLKKCKGKKPNQLQEVFTFILDLTKAIIWNYNVY